ncbi:snare-like protein, partial [Coemansia reversa NRRL 1564]
IHCVAILNRQGNPLYLRNFDKQQEDVKFHYLVYTSCDVIEERLEENKNGDLFLGLLQTIGDMAVYGYMTNTGKKIILVTSVSIESAAIRSARIKEICQSVHAAYIAMVCNPFN